MWRYTPFGEPIIDYSSVPGHQTGPIESFVGSHDHFNWGFSATGIYEITLRAEGTYIGGGSPFAVTGEATYSFDVRPVAVPEPTTFALMSLGLGCLVFARRPWRRPRDQSAPRGDANS